MTIVTHIAAFYIGGCFGVLILAMFLASGPDRPGEWWSE